MEDVRREVQILHHLGGHPNITQLKGAFEDRHNVHLVMELCSGGELFDRIVARGFYRWGCVSWLHLPVQRKGSAGWWLTTLMVTFMSGKPETVHMCGTALAARRTRRTCAEAS